MINLRRHVFRRAAVLIMTMMAICLTFMMVTVIINTTGTGLYNTSSFYDQEAALQAAQSGIDYAVTQLQNNKTWRGDSTGCGEENAPVYVKEDNGNVVGILKDKGDHISVFRIKFNFEKEGIESDKIPCSIFTNASGKDIIPNLAINMPYVSFNNLSRSEAAKVYRANNDGIGLSGGKVSNWEFFGSDKDSDATREFVNYVPPQRIYLVAEGLAGKGLRDCTKPEDVKAAIANNSVARRYVETYYSFTPPVFNGSAAFANGDLSMTVGNKLYVRSTGYEDGEQSRVAALGEIKQQKNGPGQLCSNSGINLTVGELQTFHGKLISPNPVNLEKIKLAAGDRPTTESSFSPVEKITWDKVAKVENLGDYTTNQLRSGFYYWDTVEKNGKTFYELHYYNNPDVGKTKTYVDALGVSRSYLAPDENADYKIVTTNDVTGDDSKYIKIGPSGKIAFDTDSEGNITSPTLRLRGELYCDNDLVLCSNVEHINSTVPQIMLDSYSAGSEESAENAILMGNSSINLYSSVTGVGSIVAQGDVSLAGSSIIDCSNGSVAIYSGNDVNIKSFDSIVKTPADGNAWGSDYQGNHNREGVTTWEMLNYASLYKDLHDDKKHNRGNANQLVADYFAKLGISVQNITVTPQTKEYWDGPWWDMKLKTEDYFTVVYYYANTPEGSQSYGQRLNFYSKKYCDHCWWTQDKWVEVPNYAYTDEGLSPQLQELKDVYGSIVFGDTVINGVIYAKGNVNADLGKDFKLIVNGAIRSEQGSITANCSYADLTYNEIYLERLMPKYCKLTRQLWNCW